MNLKLSIVNYQLPILLLLFFALPLKAQVTIGAQKAPHSYSQLELAGTKGGVRLPMLNTSERDALKLTSDSTEASGLVIFNTDIDCVEFWADGVWTDLCSGGALPVEKVINPIVLANLSFGSGTISGRTLFDIDATTPGSSCGSVAARTANKADFSANSTYDYVYTTSLTQTVQNVRYVIQDSEGVLQASQPLSGTLVLGTLAPGTSAPALTLKFKPDLHLPSSQPLIVGRDRSSAAKVVINIIYNNGSTDLKVAETLYIQDCSCGQSVKTVGGGWLTFMCYNLGAADTLQFVSPAQQAAYTHPADEYGDLYQWGRAADGHQLRTSESYPTNNTAVENSAVSGSDLDGKGQVASTSAAYRKFIKNNDATTFYDWRSPQVDTLWYNNGKKTVNDPCPDGWRVPSTAEFQSIINGSVDQISLSGSYNSFAGNRWQWVSSNPGYLVTPLGTSSSPTLFLPAAGQRSNASSSFVGVGASGYYWSSSSIDGSYAYYVAFSGSTLYPASNYYRSYGFSLRCVVE